MTLSISKLTLLVTTAATFAAAGCSTAPQQTVSVTTTVTAPPTSIAAVSATPSSSTSTTPSRTTATTTVALTRQACDLLTADVAKQYVGDGAQRQFSYDGHPPMPVGDGACYYKGDTREVEVSIRPRPTDPTAPINHFHVISPANRVDALGFEAYWFGPGESIVAPKDGLVITVKVANIKGDWSDQDRADDVELANLVVPRVG